MINKQDWSTYKRLLFMQASGGSVVEATATGNPLSFTTDVAKPLKSLVLPWTPVQSGTGDPSPENVRPISGVSAVNVARTGINICSGGWVDGDVNGSTGADGGDPSRMRSEYFPIKGGEKYYVVSGDQYKRIYFYDKGKEFISSNTSSIAEKEAPANACFARVVIVKSTTQTEEYSLNYPSTDTDYHAYTGQSYPVTFPALGKNLIQKTAYGGSFYNVATNSDLKQATTHAEISESNNTISVTADSGWSGVILATDLLPQGNYNIHYESSDSSLKISAYVTDKDLITISRNSIVSQNTAVTLTEPSRIAVFIGTNPAGTVTVTNLQIESGSSFTSWEPYTNTVYGGSLDVTTGVLTVEWAGFRKTWGDGGSATDMGSGITRKVYPMVDYLTTGSSNNMCNIAPYGSNENADIHFYYSGSGSTNRDCRLFLPSDTPDSTEITVITKLSQTYTIQLTPTQVNALLGDNVIWSDTNGTNTAIYFKKG